MPTKANPKKSPVRKAKPSEKKEAPKIFPIILNSQEEHAKFIVENCKKAQIDKLQLASFGLWAGINQDGNQSGFSTDNPIAKILDTAQEKKIETEIIIGVAIFTSRAGHQLPPCIYCADTHRRNLQRLFQCRKRWETPRWLFHPKSHTKLAIGYKKGEVQWAIVGGHNLSDSDLSDFSLVLDPITATKFIPIFETLKAQSDPDISEIRAGFEEKVKDAKSPPNPEEKLESLRDLESHAPKTDRPIPSSQDLYDFLLALARKKYVEKEEFTRLSRACSWTVNQRDGNLNPNVQKVYQTNKLVKAGLKAYQKFLEK